ncbi:DNA processing protein [Caldicoprobacter guelmensis]|uniref:DNA-processing protein DprA n=1 Tax=Caldicoprobacter guelmensis TaxID=1170224 RepID=UPI001957695C|nr:DNA-processing protein DprA [Caldicoprobacter guelmensis]MBM7583203.1 DNA processing protein [Caldicoprobacter guelmensis]
MRYSEVALKVLAAKECGIIKTNAQFWKQYADREKFENEVANDERVIEMAERIRFDLELADEGGIVCSFDKDFPYICSTVKNKGEKPFLLFYKGDLSLLQNLNSNVAVIGLVDPDEEIIRREKMIVEKLVENGLVVVSGLAKGCDTVAHKICLEKGGKTIAVLPSQVNKVFPAENRGLADEIVKKGGLLISEYYKDASSKYEMTNRLVSRDRLQAMFSKAVILIASYRKGEGDSGSRHAMEAAEKYGVERYVMFNKDRDEDNKKFGLNKDLLCENKAKILTHGSINEIKMIKNSSCGTTSASGEQLKFFS